MFEFLVFLNKISKNDPKSSVTLSVVHRILTFSVISGIPFLGPESGPRKSLKYEYSVDYTQYSVKSKSQFLIFVQKH